MALLKQSTTYNRTFLIIGTGDHITGQIGVNPLVNLSKDGAAFSVAGGAVSALASGYYKIALTTTDTNTLGDLAYFITALSSDPTGFVDQIVSFNPQDGVRLGLSALPSANIGTATGLPIAFDATGRVDVGNINTAVITAASIAAGAIASGKFTSGAITNTILAADAFGASQIAADAVTEIQSGLATASALSTVQSDTDNIQTRLPAALVNGRIDAYAGSLADNVITSGSIDGSAAIKIVNYLLTGDLSAVTGEASRSVLNAIRFIRNKWTASGTTLSVKKEDDATEAWSAVLTTDAAANPITAVDPA